MSALTHNIVNTVSNYPKCTHAFCQETLIITTVAFNKTWKTATKGKRRKG
jgi:hypothetical protein